MPLHKTPPWVGCMLSEIPYPNLAVLFKNNGLDFWIIDTEHGGFDYYNLTNIVMLSRLCQLPTIIRLADNQRRDIIRLSDMGAEGFLLPMTHARSDIEAVIQHARYSPSGKRGISSTRAHAFYESIKLTEYMQNMNDRMMIFAQIESKQGIENIQDIASVFGLSGVILGPNDLACDMDCIGDSRPILEAIEIVSTAASKANVISGIITSSDVFLKKSKECGMQLFCIGSELSMLKKASMDTIHRFEEV